MEVDKNLTKAFCSSPPKMSCYLGCSGGGPQDVKAAGMVPGDFDGIVVGELALNFNNMSSWRASFFDETESETPANFISADLWENLIHDEVLCQSGTIDGVQDGIIENPTLWNFRPEELICPPGYSTGDCLGVAQVEIVRQVFSSLYGSSSELVFPAMQPGREVKAAVGLYDCDPWLL